MDSNKNPASSSFPCPVYEDLSCFMRQRVDREMDCVFGNPLDGGISFLDSQSTSANTGTDQIISNGSLLNFFGAVHGSPVGYLGSSQTITAPGSSTAASGLSAPFCLSGTVRVPCLDDCRDQKGNQSSSSTCNALASSVGVVGSGAYNLSQGHETSSLALNTNSTSTANHGSSTQSVVQQPTKESPVIAEVFDPEFKYIYDVPSDAVVHLPPARLNITRLVWCRNYRPNEAGSCALGNNCKFVHANCDCSTLKSHPIHVNYIWRSAELCTYRRLPAGETLELLLPSNTIEAVASDRVLLTTGALGRDEVAGPLSACVEYDTFGTCYHGERCLFIHRVTVDPTVRADFKRVAKKPKETAAKTAEKVALVGDVSAVSAKRQKPHGRTEMSHSLLTPTAPIPSMGPHPFMLPGMSIDGVPCIAAPPPPFFPSRTSWNGTVPIYVATPSGPVSQHATNLNHCDDPSLSAYVRHDPHSSHAAPQKMPINGVRSVDDVTERLQQVLAQQRVPAIAISVEYGREAQEALQKPNSLGTLLFLPKGSTTAMVLGALPSHRAEDAGPIVQQFIQHARLRMGNR